MMELWRNIVGFENEYEVSNLGRIRSLIKPNGRRDKPKILCVRLRYDGYVDVSIRGKSRLVHRLVAFAWLGSPAKGETEINHLSAIRDDNRASNLEWCTSSQNQYYAFRVTKTKLPMCGEENPLSKLTEKDVFAIRELYEKVDKCGKKIYSQNKLAKMFGTVKANIWAILKRKTWKHI